MLFRKSSPKRNFESPGIFFFNSWYWLSGQYAIWSRLFYSRSVFTWLKSVSESVQSWTIVLILLPRMVVYKCLLFFNSSNPLVILEIASNAFKMQPCIFCVFRSLDLVFDWSISLQISGLQFLIFKEIKFLDLRCFFQFFDQFFLTYITLFIILANFFPIGGPVFLLH